jgi:hypothetical protein
MRTYIAALILLLAPLPLCSQSKQPSTEKPGKQTNSTAVKTSTSKPPENVGLEKYGIQLLEIAEADAGAIEGGTRAYVLMQVARGYEKTNKVKSIELLENALVSTRFMEEDKTFGTRARLQKDILNALVPLAPERADELLSQVDTAARGEVLKSLLGYYESKKQQDRAIEVIYRIGREQEIPYDAVGRVMAAMPKEKSGEAMQLFTTALGSFRNHDHGENTGFAFGGSTPISFPDLITVYWQQLPPQLVLESVDEVLRQSKPKDGEIGAGHAPTITTGKGTASFGSMYEYSLFQLLPVLRELDPAKVEQLLRDNQQVKALAAKYPEGNKSLLDGNESEGRDPEKKTSAGFSVGFSGDAQVQAKMQAQQQGYSRAAEIANASIEHPQDAIAQALALSNVSAREVALEGIARENLKKNASVARAALRELIELAPRLDGFEQTRAMNTVSSLYVRMGDTDSAKSAVEKGFAGVEKIYKEDTNADDPNQALKAYWPSTQAYVVLLRSAGRMSAPWALTLLKEIPDAEIKAAAEVSLASEWLKLPGSFAMVIKETKSDRRLWMSFIE